MNNDLVQELEAFVDKHGLLHILTALELMCNEKAAHLRGNWQDGRSAKTWEKAGDAIFKAACSPSVAALT